MTERIVCGVDEVGRGPLAGPVIAAAVVLDPDHPIAGLRDSKKISEKKREILNIEIREKALSWCIARADVDEIDELNILHASMLAMKRAVEGLEVAAHHALIDGNRVPDLQCSAEAIVGGDNLVDCISAASIIAKVARDHEMVDMDNLYPGYGLAKHKGYPTKVHMEALNSLGITEIHRRSFGPVKRILEAV
ncbi:MAG: ribonuclease HII [Gammaproteobacteria bacterium]|nr:ribonuclease HII [Gammaproteobacteria bacterium]